MLHRASKHGSERGAFRRWQKTLDALYLPWLCPSLCGATQPRSRKTSTVASSRLITYSAPCLSTLSSFHAHRPKTRRRGLASAVAAGHVTSQDGYIPFEASHPSPNAELDLGYAWLRPITPPVLPAFDPNSPLIINDKLETTPRRFRSTNAISGEVVEILRTLRACIQVDRLERAATLMRRLNEIYKPNATELLAAHNEYLRELVQKTRHTKDSQILRHIHKWFEVDLRGIGVIPDATTYALMVEAALQESSPKRVDRTVKRYMYLAGEAGIRDNVMQVILTISGDQNVGRIIEVGKNQPTISFILTSHRLPPRRLSLPLQR